MRLKPKISVVLITKRPLASGKFPIKLRASFRREDGSWYLKHYDIGYAVSKADYRKIRITKGKKSAYNEKIDAEIRAALERAAHILKDRDRVTIEEFDREYLGTTIDSSVQSVMDKYINQLNAGGHLKTAMVYQGAARMVEEFQPGARFSQVTIEWLKRLEAWMLGRNRSITTISIYLRALSKIYKDAIFLGLVRGDSYPFGPRQFLIRKQVNNKRALTEKQKDSLLAYKSKDDGIMFAKDFFVLSYFCSGVNMNDILQLKGKNIVGEQLEFDRGKTFNTSRVLKKVVVFIRPEVRAIIKRRGTITLDPDAYIFPFYSNGMSAIEELRAKDKFIKKINAGLKRIRKDLGLPFALTTYVARHTFANIMLTKGASKEYIQEALGHQSMQTTENYISGFDLETRKKMAGKL